MLGTISTPKLTNPYIPRNVAVVLCTEGVTGRYMLTRMSRLSTYRWYKVRGQATRDRHAEHSVCAPTGRRKSSVSIVCDA